MPTISPWEDRYTRPALKRHTREFKTPDGTAFRLTLEELDELGAGQVQDCWQDLISRYVTPPAQNGNGKTTPEPLPGGQGTLKVSRHTCFILAHLLTMQRPAEGDEWPAGEWAYTFKDWIGVLRNWPLTWRKIRAFADEVASQNEADEEADPNA